MLRFAASLPRPECFKRYLFIGPHPGDVELGAGATAAKLAAAGKAVCFLVCTDGRYALRSCKGPAEGFRVLGQTHMHCLPEAGL